MKDLDLEESALSYHSDQRPGKLEIRPTKAMANQRDLALAYSPGVAFPCVRIKDNPADAAKYTGRGNLVAVVTNGSAVLGLGSIGPLAAKPVMEGKAVLFKKFAGIDVFDIELDESDPEKLVDIIAAMEPTFGAINLEDIKAPECFIVESRLRECMNIPVFHDDQHGTAIVTAAAIRNGLKIVGKKIDQISLVSTGGGAAGLACLDQLVSLGLRHENIILVDLHGVVHEGRAADMNPYKSRYARDTPLRTLGEAIEGADVFLGLSGPGVLKQEMVARMADKPLILAMANPAPEIWPEEVRAVRPDAIIATGRSDYPNQVNNVLCFPFIFRGALDVGATTINEEMKIACVDAIADLAMRESTDDVVNAYRGETLRFGPDFIIPTPFDPRLIVEVSYAVARAAMQTGVAARPIADLDAYRERLRSYSYRSWLFMQPIIEVAKRDRERLVYAEGENETVLMATQAVVDEQIADPILIGRQKVVEARIDRLGLRLRAGQDFELVDPQSDPRYKEYWQFYHSLVCRRGVSVSAAKTEMRTNTTIIAACMVAKGEADAMICGTIGRYDLHLRHIIEVIGTSSPNQKISALSTLLTRKGVLFFSDTHIGVDPSTEEIVEKTLAAAHRVASFGIKPKVALLSHSNFGSSKASSAKKMHRAVELLKVRAPELEVDGEMHAMTALNAAVRATINPHSTLLGEANLLIMPSLDTANIAMELIRSITDATLIGPILSGVAKPAHIVTSSVTAKGIFNISAIAVADAWRRQSG
ncbi:NADP-dependent malic enzyme [Gammaproteobacteria bacterium]|nr:NADP-dependent malic enzyme [Gammaproteobacteria bacterium]